MLVTTGAFDPSVPTTSVELAPGRVVTIATSVLLQTASSEQMPYLEANVDGISKNDEMTVIPVIAEELVITKKVVPVETVRLVTTTEQVPERVDVDLNREQWEVTRMPIGVEVGERTPVRIEGEATIYPLFEERLITRKALFLTEEIHVRRTMETRRETVNAELRREVLTVERTAL